MGPGPLFLCVRAEAAPESRGEFSAVYTTLLNKYYVDELYDLLLVEPTKHVGTMWLDWFDRTSSTVLFMPSRQRAESGAAASHGRKNM